MATLPVSILFNASTRAAQRGLAGLQSAVGGVTSSFTNLKTIATGAIAAIGIGKLFGDALGVAKDFESQLSVITGLLELNGLSGEKLAKSIGDIEAESKRLGSTTQFSASQAAAGFEVLLRAGLDTEKAIAAIPVVLDTAAAAGISLDEAASRLLSTTSNLQLGVEGMQRASDVLNVAAAKADTNFQQLNDAVAVAGSNARLYGVELEQLTGALSILANNAFKGTEAGTGLRNMFGELRNEASPVNKALKEANVNAADLNEVFTFLSSGTDQARATMFRFTEEARRAVQILLDAGGTDGIEQFAEQLLNIDGATAGLAKRMTDNLEGALKSLGSAWEGLQLQFVNQDFIDQIRGGIESLTATIGDFSNSQELVLFREGVIQLFRDAQAGLASFLERFDFTEAKASAADFATSFENNLIRVRAAAGSVGSIVEASISGLTTAYRALEFAGNVAIKKFFELKVVATEFSLQAARNEIEQFRQAGQEAPQAFIERVQRLEAELSAARDTVSALDLDAERSFAALNDAASRTAKAFEDFGRQTEIAAGKSTAALKELPVVAVQALEVASPKIQALSDNLKEAQAKLKGLLSAENANGEEIAAQIQAVETASQRLNQALNETTDAATSAGEAQQQAATTAAAAQQQAADSAEQLQESTEATAEAVTAQVDAFDAQEQSINRVAQAERKAASTTEEAAERTESALRRTSEARKNAERGSSQLGGAIVSALQGINALGTRATNFYNRLVGSTQQVTEGQNQYNAAVARFQNLWDLNRSAFSRIDNLGRFVQGIALTQINWNKQMARSVELQEQIQEGMQNNTLSAGELRRAVNTADRSLDLLSDQQLAPLRNAIEQAKRRFEDLADTIDSRTDSLQDRLDRLRGDEEAILAREIDNQREQIEADRDRAGNNAQLLRELDRQLAALREIETLERRRLRQDQEATAGQPTVDIPRQNRGGSSISRVSTQGGGVQREIIRERETVLPVVIPREAWRQALYSEDLEIQVRRQRERREELLV